MQVCKRHECDEDTALKIINSKESIRASYYNYYTGKKWGYSQSYDLCVDSSKLGIEGTVDFLAYYIQEWLKRKEQ